MQSANNQRFLFMPLGVKCRGARGFSVIVSSSLSFELPLEEAEGQSRTIDGAALSTTTAALRHPQDILLLNIYQKRLVKKKKASFVIML